MRSCKTLQRRYALGNDTATLTDSKIADLFPIMYRKGGMGINTFLEITAEMNDPRWVAKFGHCFGHLINTERAIRRTSDVTAPQRPRNLQIGSYLRYFGTIRYAGKRADEHLIEADNTVTRELAQLWPQLL